MSETKIDSYKDYSYYVGIYEDIIKKNHLEWEQSEWLDYADYVMEIKLKEDEYLKKYGDITLNMSIDKFYEIAEHYGFKIIYKQEYVYKPTFSKSLTTEEELILICEDKGLVLHAHTSMSKSNLGSFTLYGELDKNDIRSSELYALTNDTDGLIYNIKLQECYRNFASPWTLWHYISFVNDEEYDKIRQQFGFISNDNIHEFADFNREQSAKITYEKIKLMPEISSIINESALNQLLNAGRKK